MKNFGDLVTPELCSLWGYTPIFSEKNPSTVYSTGSVIHMIPKGACATVIGSGLISNMDHDISSLDIRSVRGHLTRECLNLPRGTPIGDPGLLAGLFLKNRKIRKKYEFGLIPHYVDQTHDFVRNQRGKKNVKIIDVRQSARKVTQEIAECDGIFSSSLHGLIVADSLGIPNAWMEFSDKVVGNGFKFRDYGTSVDREMVPIKPESNKKLREFDNNLEFGCESKISLLQSHTESLLKSEFLRVAQ